MSTQTEILEDVVTQTEKVRPKSIIIWDDDVNTFEWIIQSLQEVCGHGYIQACQCAHIIHNNGKCGVKNGALEKLQPMLWELLDRKITATIEDGI